MIDILRKVYLPTAAVGIVVDLVWIGLVAQRFYQRTIGGLLRDDVQWAAAAAFYLLYVAAILVFVVQPAIERESLTRAVAMGAFLGIVAYGTYDLTSLALIRGFPAIVAAVDMAWGAAFTAFLSAIGFFAWRLFLLPPAV